MLGIEPHQLIGDLSRGTMVVREFSQVKQVCENVLADPNHEILEFNNYWTEPDGLGMGKVQLFIRNLTTHVIHELVITTENHWTVYTRYGVKDVYALYAASETDQLKTRAAVEGFMTNQDFARSMYAEAYFRDLGMPVKEPPNRPSRPPVSDESIAAACGWYEVESDPFEVYPSEDGGLYARMPDGEPINPGWVMARGRPAPAPPQEVK